MPSRSLAPLQHHSDFARRKTGVLFAAPALRYHAATIPRRVVMRIALFPTLFATGRMPAQARCLQCVLGVSHRPEHAAPTRMRIRMVAAGAPDAARFECE